MISRKCPVCGTNEHVYVVDKGGYVEGCIGKIVRTFFLSALTGRVAPINPKKTSADFYLCACAKCGHRFEVRD